MKNATILCYSLLIVTIPHLILASKPTVVKSSNTAKYVQPAEKANAIKTESISSAKKAATKAAQAKKIASTQASTKAAAENVQAEQYADYLKDSAYHSSNATAQAPLSWASWAQSHVDYWTPKVDVPVQSKATSESKNSNQESLDLSSEQNQNINDLSKQITRLKAVNDTIKNDNAKKINEKIIKSKQKELDALTNKKELQGDTATSGIILNELNNTTTPIEIKINTKTSNQNSETKVSDLLLEDLPGEKLIDTKQTKKENNNLKDLSSDLTPETVASISPEQQRQAVDLAKTIDRWTSEYRDGMQENQASQSLLANDLLESTFYIKGDGEILQLQQSHADVPALRTAIQNLKTQYASNPNVSAVLNEVISKINTFNTRSDLNIEIKTPIKDSFNTATAFVENAINTTTGVVVNHGVALFTDGTKTYVSNVKDAALENVKAVKTAISDTATHINIASQKAIANTIKNLRQPADPNAPSLLTPELQEQLNLLGKDAANAGGQAVDAILKSKATTDAVNELIKDAVENPELGKSVAVLTSNATSALFTLPKTPSKAEIAQFFKKIPSKIMNAINPKTLTDSALVQQEIQVEANKSQVEANKPSTTFEQLKAILRSLQAKINAIIAQFTKPVPVTTEVDNGTAIVKNPLNEQILNEESHAAA